MTVDTLTREDTGTHAVVRIIDPGVHESAPYSRAVGILDRWVAAERHAADEFTAWLKGRIMQAAAEMQELADDLGLPPLWAELPADPVPAVFAGIRARYGTIGEPSPFDPNPPAERPVRYDKDEVQAQLAARFGPAPDETMPGRAVVPGDGIPVLAAAYRGERPFVPDPADYPQPGRYRGPRSRLWRRVDGWLRDKDTRLRARLNERFTPVKEED